MSKITVTGQLTLTGGQLTISPPPPPPTGPQLWAWGRSKYGELGNDLANFYSANQSSPIQVSALTDWADISAAEDHNLAVKTDGTLWSWGINSNGQLGQGDLIKRSSPVQIGALTDWASVSAASRFSMAIKTDNTLWSWGINNAGRLGHKDTNTKRSSPVQIGLLANWAIVSAGGDHTTAIKTDGTMWTWSFGHYGALGIGDTVTHSSPVQIGNLNTWASVSTSPSYSPTTVAIKTDNTMWTWGRNNKGQLGLGDTIARSSPVQIPGTNWASAVVDDGVTHAIKTDGSLWGWGDQQAGEIGTGVGNIDSSSPVQIGSLTDWSILGTKWFTPFVIKTDGSLWGWGRGTNGKRGDGTVASLSSPVQIGSDTNWTAISGGDEHTIAIKTDGTLEAWGQTKFGQLGNSQANVYSSNYSSPIQIGSLVDWADIDVGDEHSMAVKTDGTLWAWGLNKLGELGKGDLIKRSSPTQVGLLSDWASVSGGSRFSMAIKTNGTLWSWGIDNAGRLGHSVANTKRSSPVQIGLLANWAIVSAGGDHTTAIKTDGTMWTWSFGHFGALGLGDTVTHSSPVQIGNLNTWASVSTGASYGRPTTVAIKTDNTMWTWGRNDRGQLGLGDKIARSSPVQIPGTNWASATVGYGVVQAIKTDGSLWSWGDQQAGEIGTGVGNIDSSSPVQIGILTDWSILSKKWLTPFVIKTDGSLWGWGRGDEGKRGDGTTANLSSPVQIGSETNWTKISGGGEHTIAIKTTT